MHLIWGEVKGKIKNIGCVPCDIPGTTEPSSLWWDMLLLGEPDWSLIEQPHVSRVSANSRFRWSITLSVTLHSPLFSNKFCTIIRAEEKLTLPPKLQWSIVSLKCNKIWAITSDNVMITVPYPEIIIHRTNTTNIHTLIITHTRPVHPFLMPIVLWDLIAVVVLASGTHQQNQQQTMLDSCLVVMMM